MVAEGLRGSCGVDGRAVEFHGERWGYKAAFGVCKCAYKGKFEIEFSQRLVDGACPIQNLKGGVLDGDVVDGQGGKTAVLRERGLGGSIRSGAVAAQEPANVFVVKSDNGIETVNGHFVNNGGEFNERLSRGIDVEAVE